MRKLWSLILVFAFLFVGCGQSEETNLSEMTGLIVEKEGNRILVIENVTKDQLDPLDLDELLNQGHGAIWFEVEEQELFESLHVGDKVAVEYNIVLESYPGQSKAVSITKLDK
ncbi:MAG: YobA family protein [Bacillaceae bacterium]|nr:YobA family protein [Bacillaceae bacterium]